MKRESVLALVVSSCALARTGTALSDSTQKNAFADESPVDSEDDQEDNEVDTVTDAANEGSRHIVLKDEEAGERIKKAREARKEYFESEQNTLESNSSKQVDEFEDERFENSDEEDLSLNEPADVGGDMEKDGRKHPHKFQDISKNKDGMVVDKSRGSESNQKEGILENSEKKEHLQEDLNKEKKTIPKEAKKEVEEKQNLKKTECVSSSLEAKMREAASVGQELARTALEAKEGLHKSITDLRQETKDLERETLTRIRQEVGRYFGG